MIRQFIFVCSAFLIMTASCGEQDTDIYTTDTYTIETIDGIEHIQNHAPQWGDEPKVALEFVQKIGDIDAVDENYQLFKTIDAINDHEGNLYVLDSGNHRIQKYDSQGKYLLTMGRKGLGPGDLLNPDNMLIDSENNLHVINYGNYRIEVFSLEGKYIDSYRMKRIFSFFRFLGEGKLVTALLGLTPSPGSQVTRAKKLISIINNNGEIVKEFVEFKDYDDAFMRFIANLIIIEVDSKKNIIVAYTTENKIEKYSSEGNLLLSIDRTLPYEIKHEMKNFEEISGLFPDVSYVSVCAAVDYKDRLWISTYSEQPGVPQTGPAIYYSAPEKLHIEIYDNEGLWLGKIKAPENLILLRINGQKAFFTDKDLVSIHEYRILEK